MAYNFYKAYQLYVITIVLFALALFFVLYEFVLENHFDIDYLKYRLGMLLFVSLLYLYMNRINLKKRSFRKLSKKITR